MRLKIVLALAIGALISAGLLAIEQRTDYALLWLEWPGVSAAYLFWGAIGGSAVAGIFLCWAVNAFIFAAASFAALLAISRLTMLQRA
jgi:hypothetical protein